MSRPKRRIFTVGYREYLVSISGGAIDQDGNVPLRVSIGARIGKRSFCLIRGLTNRSFWNDYPNIEAWQQSSVSITPSVACGLIALAHSQGWDPEGSKANFELQITNEAIRSI